MADHTPPPPPSSSMMTALFESLSSLAPLQPAPHQTKALQPQPPPSALHRLSPSDARQARGVFVTLHVLFPHELLPALDILDRGLVTKLTVGEGKGAETDRCEVYYVQSSSAVTSRSAAHGRSSRSRATSSTRYTSRKPGASAAFYEVRLDSWNCSCPAFSVSAFQALGVHADEHNVDDNAMRAAEGSSSSSLATFASPGSTGWVFGGVATNTSTHSVPSCKHILAAVLAKTAPNLFDAGVHVKEVSKEELAGWGGGWGELGVQ